MCPDNAYQNAVARKKKLQDELADINQFLDLYRRFASEVPAVAGSSDPVSPNEEEATPRQPRRQRWAARASISQDEFVKEARAIILEYGRPMRRGELVEAFEKKGIEIGGSNVSKNLGTKIWRAGDEFVNFDGEGYWPKGVPRNDSSKDAGVVDPEA